ncbi:MAG TPA: GAF domain-containing sensor histidine kinase [Myxococcales bacterium]|nr:GAF domain-containing sensor histidine kinase [Myxococcales bacterium]
MHVLRESGWPYLTDVDAGVPGREPRRLSDFLRTHRNQILSAWLEAACRLSPARDLEHPILLDHIPQFIDDLADFLDEVRAGHPATEPLNPPTKHALERLEVGYNLAHVVEEYAILRQCIVELVHREGAPSMRSAQLARLHSGIDRAIVTSTARYHEASERTLRALDRISSAALTRRDAEEMVPELLKVLLETCASVDGASLLLLEGDVLRVQAAAGSGLESTIGEAVPVGASLAGLVAQTRAPVASRDAATDPMVTRESIRRSGLRGYYGVPLMLGEELIGVATIGSRTAAEFSEDDRLLFRTMAGRAAALIAKARLDTALSRRNAELAAALEYRDRLLGVLSHDLRNPLAVVLLSAQLLERAPLSQAQQRTLRRLADNARRVDHMVRDLLDYTRLRQNQELPISSREVDLLAVCQQVLDGIRVLHPGVDVRCSSEGKTSAWCDPERMAQVISNLVSNAILYGHADGPVTVFLRGADGEIGVDVHNDGAPIPQDLLPHIFEPFRRGAAATKESPAGLGLGLFISQQIVAAHGGKIAVRSRDGEGTTLRIRLPIRAAASHWKDDSPDISRI